MRLAISHVAIEYTWGRRTPQVTSCRAMARRPPAMASRTAPGPEEGFAGGGLQVPPPRWSPVKEEGSRSPPHSRPQPSAGPSPTPAAHSRAPSPPPADSDAASSSAPPAAGPRSLPSAPPAAGPGSPPSAVLERGSLDGLEGQPADDAVPPSHLLGTVRPACSPQGPNLPARAAGPVPRASGKAGPPSTLPRSPNTAVADAASSGEPSSGAGTPALGKTVAGKVQGAPRKSTARAKRKASQRSGGGLQGRCPAFFRDKRASGSLGEFFSGTGFRRANT